MAEARKHRLARKGAFWVAVAGVAVLANFGAEFITDVLCDHGKCPPGLAQLVAYTHKGAKP